MARARKKAPKRKAKQKAKKKASKKPARRRARAVARAPRVPAQKKGESLVAYHDRLADLIYEANQAGDMDFSEKLQEAAGRMARTEPSIQRPRRGAAKKRRGPGTYPWYACIEDQVDQYGDYEKAAAVCGRIRADSRARYPVYWSARGLGRRTGRMTRTRSGWGANPQGDYAIFCAEDESGWHWWTMDERGGGLAAASTKPYRSETAACSAAKRAARAHDARVYPVEEKKAKQPKGRGGRTRLPSVLTRI
jgi:hypothetical protein